MDVLGRFSIAEKIKILEVGSRYWRLALAFTDFSQLIGKQLSAKVELTDIVGGTGIPLKKTMSAVSVKDDLDIAIVNGVPDYFECRSVSQFLDVVTSKIAELKEKQKETVEDQE